MSNAWQKDPSATLDYLFDWSLWLQPGETIVISSFTASAGLTISSRSQTATSATVWLAGGTAGQPYRVANQITTDQGRTEDRSITVRVVKR